jgi:hypothetical protein
LSSTNIFIDTHTWNVHVIDWDGMYHPSLVMPPNTTFGTNGYIAPFVRAKETEAASTTWTRGADRFSMAVLNVEFLSVGRNSPVTGDGGLLDQEEIYNLGGSGLNKIIDTLQRDYSNARGLFDRTLRAGSFNECPSPDEWKALGAGITAPSLKDVYDPQPDFLKFIQELQKARKIQRPAPNLRDIEVPNFSVPHVPATKDDGPPAPSLAQLEQPDWGNLFPRHPLESTQPAPRLAEMPALDEGVTPPTKFAPALAAPSLTDVEDPLSGAHQERRE